MRLTTVVLCLVCGAALAHAQAPVSTAEREVMAVVNALFDGMRKSDSGMVRPLFHARARFITMDLRSEGRPVRVEENPEAFIKSIGQVRTEVFDEQLANVKTQIDGSLASVWADYRFFIGTRLSHCGVDHFLLVKESGKWQIIELADTRRTVNCEARGQKPGQRPEARGQRSEARGQKPGQRRAA